MVKSVAKDGLNKGCSEESSGQRRRQDLTQGLTDRDVVSDARWHTASVCLARVGAAGMERSQTKEMAPQVSLTGRSVQVRHVEGTD